MDAESNLLSIFTPKGSHDPYPALAELRRTRPVHLSETLGSHVLTRFADCQQVLTGPEFLVPDRQWCAEAFPDQRARPAAEFFYSSLLGTNGPDHSRLRGLVAGALGARQVAALQATAEKITEELLDAFADATSSGGTANFQELVGRPLPVTLIGTLIGVPRAEQGRFERMGRGASRLLEPVRTPEDWARADRAVVELREFFGALLRERRARPAEDLASALLEQRHAVEPPPTDRELADLLLLLFVAGFETTTALLGTTVHTLLSHPGEFALVRDDPALVPAAIEESLRWDSPVLLTERIAARPVEVAGVQVPRGGSVTTVLAAANRDPGRHPEPDRFTVRRPDNKALSFSAGRHHCPGATLARTEAAALLGRLVRRFPDLALAGPPVRRSALTLRSFDDLPLATTG
ncbi:cytochrome P450 [Kitasatospora sp. MBT63]|uniref:cytochrome P450 n=1 Tax=Kitasatospora sp. MBT63 TaxID=1444768 RepID=UPI00068C5327|nr:cytochrome P450 [Kitasatospora sp. MBT63]